MINTFIFMVAIHFIADFPFQGDWLGTKKGKSWELMTYHCLIYSGTFVVFGGVETVYAAAIFVSHMVIDPLRARWHFIKSIWLDQLLHIATIALLVSLGMK